MDVDRALLDIAKLLLAEDDDARAPEVLLRRVLDATGADRGFIVVREGDTFEEKFNVEFGGATVSTGERRFSRSLAREAIRTRELVYTPDPLLDPRFSMLDSVQALRAGAAVVAPLLHGDQVDGVIYLQHRAPGRDFPEEARRFVAGFADLAGLFLRRALEREAARKRSRGLAHELFARHDFPGIVTRHPRMLELLRMVAQVAASDATVLVRGETGAGKELVARAVHLNSPRRARPFVALHTTALPGTILESELFGHARGAFTGADRDRKGRVASADGGTLFLDEIAEIPLEVQAKLLRFLQFGEIQRLGSDRTEKVDVRVVAATHQDLAALVQAGRFRQDLYFRLKVVELSIPPLRDRAADIPLLLDHYLDLHWRRPGPRPVWTPAAERALHAHRYPGNVRELAHIVERACVLATSPDLDLDLLPPELSPPSAEAAAAPRFEAYTGEALEAARAAATAEVERVFLRGLMDRAAGNVSQAARESGIHRSYLQKLLARHRGERG